MKLYISSFIVVFIFSFKNSIYSQQGPKVNPENMVGIIIYEPEKVIKKIKLKKEAKKIIIKKSISIYNNKINEIKIFSYLTFNNVQSFITKTTNKAKLTNDYRPMEDARLKVQEMLDPIRSKIKIQDSILNTNFKKELSEKQYKTWLKFQQRKLKALKPKSPENHQMQSGQYSQQSRRQQQGMNRRRY